MKHLPPQKLTSSLSDASVSSAHLLSFFTAHRNFARFRHRHHHGTSANSFISLTNESSTNNNTHVKELNYIQQHFKQICGVHEWSNNNAKTKKFKAIKRLNKKHGNKNKIKLKRQQNV
uniref:Uncharacterized protein n=1 Tax=Bactrocera latifrons TaxID=174628 RepID=A0A0K8W4X3_BACLA